MAIISPGNTKLGWIPNISMTPIESCVNCELCKSSCYALKAYQQYPTHVKPIWDSNFKEATENRSKYFSDIRRYLLKYHKPYFRWHVAGDIIDQDYFDNMKEIAKDFTFIKFMAMTKNYKIKMFNLPKNLNILLSVWPGMELPRVKMPLAFMQDGTETRVTNAIKCSKHCTDCYACWNIREIGKNIVFDKH